MYIYQIQSGELNPDSLQSVLSQGLSRRRYSKLPRSNYDRQSAFEKARVCTQEADKARYGRGIITSFYVSDFSYFFMGLMGLMVSWFHHFVIFGGEHASAALKIYFRRDHTRTLLLIASAGHQHLVLFIDLPSSKKQAKTQELAAAAAAAACIAWQYANVSRFHKKILRGCGAKPD
ncbi:hypothetical protein BZA77DRAFT_345531 [Pyronema omphalodes]|nr:hypothetical protein BZA77DRAFT_345531 [Pyronema omphalodes]